MFSNTSLIQAKWDFVRFPNFGPRQQNQILNMDHAEKVVISSNIFSIDGPDLGFLRLPPDSLSALQATNVFFNLGKRREAVLSFQPPTPSYIADAIVGVIGEWTEDLATKQPRTRLKGIQAIFGPAKVIRDREANSFDLLDTEITLDVGFPMPSSFGGTSGGALWRFSSPLMTTTIQPYWKNGYSAFRFTSSSGSNRERIITCHGPKGIYRDLLEKIREKWPD